MHPPALSDQSRRPLPCRPAATRSAPIRPVHDRLDDMAGPFPHHTRPATGP